MQADCLWRECEEPLRYALMTSQLYSHLAQRELGSLQKQQEQQELSERYERWAVAVLSACTESVGMSLVEGQTERWHMALLDLALAGESRDFIAHQFCQSIIAQRWRGNYEGSGCMLAETSTTFEVLLRALCQLLPDLLGGGPLLERAAPLFRPDSYAPRATKQQQRAASPVPMAGLPDDSPRSDGVSPSDEESRLAYSSAAKEFRQLRGGASSQLALSVAEVNELQLHTNPADADAARRLRAKAI